MNILDEGKLSIEQLKELVFEYTKNFREEVLEWIQLSRGQNED